MTQTEFIYIFLGFILVVVITAMATSHQTNLFGIGIVILIAGHFAWKNRDKSYFAKGVLMLIAYVLTISIVGFALNASSIIMKNYGMTVLVPQLSLKDNADPTITTVAPNAMGSYPASDKYTYSFSVFIKNVNVGFVNRYLFYRWSDSGKTTKNIGLRIGDPNVNGETLDSLYLDYTTTESTQTVFTKKINKVLPIGEWTTIVLTVNKNQVDIYIDGKTLSDSFIIQNLKSPSDTEPIQFGNMPAYLANFSYSSSVIEPSPDYLQYLSYTDSIYIS